jgi:hypothetical protein
MAQDLYAQARTYTERSAGERVRGRVERPDGTGYYVQNRSYTNEDPEQLRAQGYEQDENGTWFKTVGTVAEATDEDLYRLARMPSVKSGQLEAFSSAATEQIPFLDEAAAGVAGLLTGTPYSEVRALQGDLREVDRAQYGAARNAGGVAGFTAGLAAPAGAARGALRVGGVNAAYGTAYGLGAGEGSFADRLPGGVAGGVTGFIGGAGIAKGAEIAAPYAERLGGIATAATRPVREAVGRIAGRRPDPEIVAARRITDQLRRRGLSEDQIAAEIEQYRAAGLNPSVLDVGGENVFATTRAAAAVEGPGREAAVGYRNMRASELAPRTIERTRALVGDPRDALTMAGDITTSRRQQARADYGPAYETQVVVPDVALRALRGEEGSQAMAQARRIASAEQDFQTMEEIDRLITADLDQAPVASGRALEYVRRAYRDLADAAPPELAVGLESRLTQIDSGLDAIPELRQARRAYADASGQIDALGGVPDPRTGRQRLGRPDRAPMSAIGERSAERYGAYVEGLPESAALPNQVYQREQLINQLAGAREGAVGPINSLTAGANQPLTANSPTVARNLEATFPGQGQRYQQDLALARQQMTRAEGINPNAGSRTANTLMDQGAEGIAQGAEIANRTRGQTFLGAALGAVGSLARRAGGLNEAERAAIVQAGISDADELFRIVRLADESRAAGRPPPREVRAYIIDITSQLGSRNPVALELTQRLLPPRVLAEEERQPQ